MLEFTDTPYAFYPPNPSPVLIRLTRFLNRTLVLPGRNHRIRGLQVLDGHVLRELRTDPQVRLLFVANHSTHSDPQILAEAQRSCGVVSSFMAAYEVFQRSRLQAWIMQRTGAFSVDRDASDRESVKTAVRVLSEGRYPLSIFPEGNVYFTNDRPSPFLEGAAFIAYKAQKKLGTRAEVVAVPVSIKVTHLSDQRRAVRDRIQSVAETLGTSVDPEAALIDEFKRVGVLAMERDLRRYGILPREPDMALTETVRHCAAQIIADLEIKLAITPKPTHSLTDRIRRLRSTIHHVRSDPDRAEAHEVAAGWADEAMLAVRLLGYTQSYLAEQPTLDRFGETSERFMEDVNSRLYRPYGDRHAFVRINPPIRLADLLEGGGASSRSAIGRINATFASSIQQGLDIINAMNPHPGGARF